MAYIYDLTDTWNAGGTTFNAIKMNVTDSASAVTSKLVSLQTNGTEHFSVTKAGVGYVSGNLGIGTASPTRKLEATDSAQGVATFKSTSTTRGYVTFQDANTTNDTQVGVGAVGNNLVLLAGSAAERMRITSGGLVGIGTASPTSKLQVTTSSSGAAASLNYDDIFVENSANAGITIGSGDTSSGGLVFADSGSAVAGYIIYGHDVNAMRFGTTAGTERMRIDSSGNLLVGTTSTAGITDGSSTNVGTQIGSGTVRSQRNDTAGLILSKATGYTSSILAQFYVSGSSVGTITTTGSATAYNTSSDVRLKDNITDADDASNLIDAIQVRKFDWKADGSHQRYGFVAQELVTVAPEAVSQPADPEDMMGVDYSKLVPMLVKEIQSLRARVAQLEGN